VFYLSYYCNFLAPGQVVNFHKFLNEKSNELILKWTKPQDSNKIKYFIIKVEKSYTGKSLNVNIGCEKLTEYFETVNHVFSKLFLKNYLKILI